MSRLKRTGAAAALTGAGMAAVALVGQWEGLRLYAYQDVIGVWTACYGETKGIKPGMKFTQAECDVMFIDSLTKHEAGMRACLKSPDTIPDPVYVSFLSLAYNVGTGAFCRSTLARKANAGDLAGACRELPKWNRAGGKVVKGLTNRRQAELKLCLSGLPS
jgi:lysozyme